jgi:hypothetical protein
MWGRQGLQEQKANFRSEFLIFQDDSPVLCRYIFAEFTRHAEKQMVSTSKLFSAVSKFKLKGKRTRKLLADVGLVCCKAPA